jgi:cytochrome c peroxidase
MHNVARHLLLAKKLQFKAASLSLIVSIAGLTQPSSAQNAPPGDPLWWQPAAIAHAQQMRAMFQDPLFGTQLTPLVIPSLEIDPDSSGLVATDQPAGATYTPLNAFFQNLGTNQRTCFTCHQPQTGWTVSAASVQQRFLFSLGNDPIFRLFDGATCPSDNVATYAAMQNAYSLLLSKGLIRIGLPLAATLTISGVDDPYGCSNNVVVNVGSTAIYSFYRRPLPSTNFFFQTSNTSNLFMWDGREPSLDQQSIDATLGHAQALAPPTQVQQTQMVGFESGLFTAQNFDINALFLRGDQANGGPEALSIEPFVLGAPQPSATSLPAPFDIYNPWASLTGTDPLSEARESIARGEAIFNSTTAKSCGGCHNTVDNGNRDNAANPGITKFFNTGLANASAAPPPSGQGLTAAALADIDISALPVFTVACNDGSALQGEVFAVTDLGRAMNSGACADIGAFKAPSLRGLASRAPYFHNGSAATLTNVANFYNDNFNIGLTPSQIQDLVNFLNTL